MTKYCTALVLFICLMVAKNPALAQTVVVNDDFSDGDFTNNPTWTDSESKFTVNSSNRLQLDAPSATEEAVITTPSTAVYGQWEALVNLDFNPSGGNLAKYYVLSNTTDLKGDVNGYYIEVGGSDDEISLYRQDGSTSTKIIDGPDDVVDTDPVNVRLRVTRDVNGNWELLADTTGGTNFASQGTVSDQTYTGSSYIGLFCDYTSTRSDLFQFDDIKVTKQNPPLRIRNLTIQDKATFDVAFNIDVDPSSVDPADFSIDNGAGSPASATLQSDNQTVRLSYNNPLPGGQYTLTINNVDDSDGNTITANTTTSFTLYDSFAAGDVIINEFVYDPAGNQSEYVEIKNTSGKYLNLEDWQLGDNTANETILSDTLTLQPHGFLVISDDTTTLSSTYGPQPYVQPGTVRAFNNDGDVVKILTGSGTRVDSLRYDDSWGGSNVALERRSDSAPSIYKENFGDAPNALGGTPGQPNELADDTTPPNLAGLTITNDQTLDLNFSERLANGPATNAGNYSLDNGISVSNAQQTAGDSVRLSLSSPLQNGAEYQLSIDNQQDIFANTAATIDTTFNYYVASPVDSGDVFINEFLYSPPSGSSEYIELYNPTSKSFDLNGWTLNDNRGNPATITNSQFIVPPDSFVVIAPDNSLAANYPEAALVNMGTNFPSLNDSGDDIVLRDSTGQRLDSLTYTPDFGGDGVALERRTTSVPPVKANFGEAPNGFGTPGSANQIGQDNTPPSLKDLIIDGNQTLKLAFSEGLADGEATNTSNYTLDHGITVNDAQQITADSVQLNLSSPLQNNTQYQLAISNQQDIFSNTAAEIDTAFTYYVVSPADSGDIFINEFLYTPPSGSSEYIELYNPTSKSFDLNGWTLNDNRGNPATITNSQFIVPPDSFVVIAPDNSLAANYPEAALVNMGSNFPSLNDSGDDIVLRDSTGQRLDSLTFTPDFGGDGVALERRTTSVPPVKANFGEAPNGFGTPGSANQIGQDNTPPDLQSFKIVNNQSLQFVFTENVTNQSATNAGNYAINQGVSISSATLSGGDTVRVSLSNQLQNNTSYTTTIDGVNDIFGNAIANRDTSFTYYKVSPADSGDIFINEFTYDPPSGSTEYIELYNTSGKSLDLQDWTVNDNTGSSDTITNGQYIVPPDSFVVLAPDQTLLQDHPDIALVPMGSRFPSLNNGGDDIVLRDDTGERLDSLTYTSAYGGNGLAVERRTTNTPPVQSNFGDAPNGFGTPGEANQIGQDTTPPSLKGLIIANNQTLKLAFSEGLEDGEATDASNYAIDHGITVDNAQQVTADSVQLNLSSALQNDTQYQLAISNQQDIFGNTAAQIDTSFTYYETSPADSGDIFINEFTYDPPEGSTEYIELYNTSSKSFDLNDWTVNDNTGNRQAITSGQYIVPPDSFVVLAPDQTLLQDHPDIALVAMGSRFPSLNNSGDDIVLRDDTGERLDSLTYTPAYGGDNVAVERRTTNAPPVQSNFGDAPNGFGTPGETNQIGQDNTPPTVDGLVIVNEQILALDFSEDLQAGPATNTSNYSISDGLSISSATQTAGDSVRLSLDAPLQNNTSYQLNVQNQQDLFGNTSAPFDTTFTYYQTSPADSADIFINEFTYDPPSGSTEYIELYNTSGKSLDLQDWTVNDNTGNRQTITKGQFIVPPNDYVVLAPDQTLKQDYPDAKLVSMGSRFPSLNNSGDDIVLRDQSGERLDSLTYTPAFGGDTVAVERRTTTAPPVAANFGDAPNGFGTPGSANQIGQDTTPPNLKTFSVLNDQSLEFVFNENVDEQSANDVNNYSLSGSPNINAVSVSGNTVKIGLSDPLQNNTSYTATIKKISDIFGNTRTNRDTTFTYFQTTTADSGDIFINEFTYDPPEGSTEYIELYNTSSKSFDLKNWTVNDNTGKRQTITDDQFIVPPNSYVVLAPDQTLKQDYPDAKLVSMGSRFPSLNNSGDDIVLRDQSGERLDSLTYTPAFGGDNVAVERRTTKAPPVAANFGDAPNGFGTPGSANQIDQDTTPPSLKAFSILNDQSLQFVFSEALNQQSATDKGNYQISGDLKITSTSLAGSDTVNVGLSGSLQNNTSYTATIKSLDDTFGNTTGTIDTTFTFFHTSPVDSGDIFINEFTSDPPSGSTEYIELYNTSGKSLDLQNWTINDNTGNLQTITNGQFVVPPNDYVVLAPDATVQENNPDAALIAMGSRFPSLNNSGDDIVLRDAGGDQLDSLRYNSSWGGNNIALERRSTDVIPVKANFGDAPNGFGTPGATNDIQPDDEPPSLESLNVIDQSSLQLILSESVTGQTATNQSNYTIAPDRNIQFITNIQDTVNITLAQNLVSGQNYDVTVTGLQDLFGNTIASTTKPATYVQISNAQPGSIVINEILYTRESAGDPEFVELFNPTDKNFSLKGWSVGDASGTTSVPGSPQLQSGGYLVLTDNQTFAAGNNKRIYISNFPSLNDDEDAVYVQNENDVTIDSLFYHANTFGGNIDGRSAERKDPNAASNDPSNFATSTASDGSTPNAQNSVYEPDTNPPSIKFARVLPNGNIQVNFSEFITLSNNVEFTLNGKTLTVASFNPNEGNTIILNAPSSLEPGTKLTLKAENLTDVEGNPSGNPLSIEVSQQLSKGDVVINEILYDPLSDSEDNKPDQAEYVELRNTRDYAVLLEGITLHDEPDENGDVRTLTPVTTKSKFIPAQGTALVYAGETTNFKQSRVATFFELSDQPETSLIRIERTTLSLASSGDAIYLADTNGATIDSVFYDESWQNQNLADTKGIALERINPEGPSSNDSNWGSSTAELGGTPNAENSIFQQPGSQQNQDIGISFNPNPFSPDGDGNDDRLFINYKLDRADYLITVRIYDRYGREVRELADGKAAGFNGSLIWDGRKDDGTSNRIGIYIVIFKAFDSADGKNRAFKKTVVLARRLH